MNMDFNHFASQYLARLKKVMDTFDLKAFEKIVQMILDAYTHETQIFIMGNGGSGACQSLGLRHQQRVLSRPG